MAAASCAVWQYRTL